MRYLSYTLIVVGMGCLFFGLFGCSVRSGSLPTADQLFQNRLAPEGTDMDALRRGRALAVTECASCHRFFFPREYSPEEWHRTIRAMGRRASLDQRQINDIDYYYQLASGTR